MNKIVSIILAVAIGGASYGASAVARIIKGADIVRPVESQIVDKQDEVKPAVATETPPAVALPTVPDNGDATQPCIEFQDKQCWDNLRVHIEGE